MHAYDTVSAHDIFIFEKFSVVFVRCTDSMAYCRYRL